MPQYSHLRAARLAATRPSASSLCPSSLWPSRLNVWLLAAGLLATGLLAAFPAPGRILADEPNAAAEVSYHRQVLPLFQAHCQGCHQPAKSRGEYVMTEFAQLLKGGESESPAIVPGKPDASYLVELITATDGKAEMPKGKPALAAADVELIRRWIAQGARDDSPARQGPPIDQEHPPSYALPPVTTSLDFSPDGKLLAVSGFHEVLLVDTENWKLAGRMVGLAERVEAVRFSPDGQRLAVTGGSPYRFGEIQIWNVAEKKLELSIRASFDTLYGGNWSPDGKLIAVGCPDNAVRAFDTTSGDQVLFQGAHDDWVLDTVFSSDNQYVTSVSRDMTVKLTEVKTQRFIDNITSITPGALKGGIQAVARHPQRDEVVLGGSDGVVKVYRMQRLTKRVIGDDANLIRTMPAMEGRVFDVAVSGDGKRIAAVSSLDGRGQLHVYSYEFDTSLPDEIKKINETVVTQRNPEQNKALAEYHGKDVKLLAQATLPSGMFSVAFHPGNQLLALGGADGSVRIVQAADGQEVTSFVAAPLAPPAAAAGAGQSPVDFIQDVNPLLSRLGCNQGTCHGAAKGKSGFKLSLRGYDALFDVRALTDDHAARRVNLASPADSLILLKATASVPHEGGQLLTADHPYYQVIQRWIASGAKLRLDSPRVARIEVQPDKPVVQQPGQEQPMQVLATYTDGSTRDVTHEAFVTSGNSEVATAEKGGIMKTVRRGEAPVLARYEGAYAATTLTVMGDREGFTWQPPETWNRVDELVAAKWKRVKILPSPLCSDDEFLRRVTLDLTGLPPTVADVETFLKDSRDPRTKRNEVIERLLASPEFLDYWTNKWADLLQVNRKFLGAPGAAAFREWIRQELKTNTPYDEFARKILTASGSNKENPAASYFKVLRDPLDTMENTTHLFLGVRFNCNKCHDHPFERWTQDQYYETAAYFAQFELQRDPASGDQRIGGTAVEGAKPLYELVVDKAEGEVIHDRTKQVAEPQFPFDCDYQVAAGASRRQQLAAWLTSPDNPYFARSYVNRLWGYLFGPGIIEPIDDIRAGNPPTNPELLDYLTEEFVRSGFDVPQMFRLICQSRTYQLSIETNPWNEDDQLNYSHAYARRLPAEVLYDAIHQVTGSTSRIPGVPAGTRAAALPDSGIKLGDGFLTNLGRPARESACECERSSGLQLGPVMALISGPTVGNAIADPQNALARLVQEVKQDEQLVDRIFLRVLSRHATEEEIASALRLARSLPEEHQRLVAKLNDYREQIAPRVAQQQQQRQERIDAAKQALAGYETEIAEREKMLDEQHAAKLKAAEETLARYESELPAKLQEWEQKLGKPVVWTVLEPTRLAASNNAKLTKEKDLSVFVTGPNGKSVYEFEAESTVANVTGIRLELLTDDRLPSKGPGRAQNGNFVLSEFSVQHGAGDQRQPVPLQNAKADFSQENYDVASAIDGKRAPQNDGWATSPKTGENRTAVFETQSDLAAGQLLFSLDQQYADNKHTIGRFRIAVTNAPRPLTLDGGIPQPISEILAVEAAKRNEAQRAELMKFYRGIDGELKKLAAAVAQAKKPRAVDPKLTALRERLAEANKPLPVDPQLEQLQADVAVSENQLGNSRLTMAQDLAWALINTPSFLFNR